MTLILLVSGLVVGCATPSIGPDYKLTPGAKTGIVAGSITYAGLFSGYRISYRSVADGSRSNTIQTGKGALLIPYEPRGDADALGARGDLFAIELPVGEYEVHRWSISSGYATVGSTSPFSIRFNVTPGRVVYLGNFHFVQTAHMGLTVTGAELSYADRSDRDVPLIKRKYPGLETAEIDYGIEKRAAYQKVGGPHATRIMVPILVPVK